MWVYLLRCKPVLLCNLETDHFISKMSMIVCMCTGDSDV